jgi:nucleotide-binding universal stress UspA family protein
MTTKTLRTKSNRLSAANKRFRRILVPVDFSEFSKGALRTAGALAADWGARLDLIHVIEPVEFVKELNFITSDGDATEAELEAKKRLATLAKGEAPNVSGVRTHVAIGKPFERIVEFAERHEVDLILMPTHGRTGFTRVLLGSTAERVVEHARCPVLVWRERGERRPA